MAAKLGLPEAAVMLGLIYEKGLGKPKDLSNAVLWYKTAASLNDAEAFNHLGRIHEFGKGCKVDYEKALHYYKKGFDLGHLDSITNYAILIQSGKGCEADEKLAFEYLESAANKSYARAQNALGNCYYQGKGVTVDYNLAVTWFKKASDQGYAAAHNNLGICYEEGRGIAKDLLAAKQMYGLASEHFHANGTNNLGYMNVLEGNFEEAIRLFNVACSLGSLDALYNLGTLYEAGCKNENGIVLDKDINAAIRYYTQAADKGCIKSQVRVATLLTCHPPPIQNYKKAIKYLLAAGTPSEDESHHSLISKGDAEAQNLLGELYELGEGTEDALPNPTEAAVWYQRAVKQGHARAAFNLAALYENGSGVEKDVDRAIRLYIEADKRGSLEARERLEELQEIEMI